MFFSYKNKKTKTPAANPLFRHLSAAFCFSVGRASQDHLAAVPQGVGGGKNPSIIYRGSGSKIPVFYGFLGFLSGFLRLYRRLIGVL